MALAIQFENNKIYVCREREGEAEPVIFDGSDHLSNAFAVTQSTQGTVVSPIDTDTGYEKTVCLHVENDGMDIRLTGDTDNISVDTVLCSLFKAIRETDDSNSDDSNSDEIVIVSAENGLLLRTAMTSGFSGATFISPTEAAIRWAGADADAQGTVGVLFCNNGLDWAYAFFNDEGDLIRNNGGGQFARVDATGLGNFLVSLQEQDPPVAQIIATGPCAETQQVNEFLSAIELYGYKVLHHPNAVVIGAATPPKSKYGRFDDVITGALTALQASDFDTAMSALETAISMFASPFAQAKQTTDQLRRQIRTEILAKSVDAEPVDAEPLYEQALTLSTSDLEKAAVYEAMLHMFGTARNLDKAEEAAILAAFHDPSCEASCHEALRAYSENTPPPRAADFNSGFRGTPSIFVGAISVYSFFFRHLFF